MQFGAFFESNLLKNGPKVTIHFQKQYFSLTKVRSNKSCQRRRPSCDTTMLLETTFGMVS